MVEYNLKEGRSQLPQPQLPGAPFASYSEKGWTFYPLEVGLEGVAS